MDAHGSAASFFALPAPRTSLDPDRVLAAVRDHRPGPGQSIAIIGDAEGIDPTIEVTEAERSMRLPLSLLVARLERSGVEDRADDVADAVAQWVDTRPVTDHAAASKGLATLGWSHRQQRVGWRVVVPRASGVVMDWVPTLHTGPAAVNRARAAAQSRSRLLSVTPLRTGEVTVWICLANPALSTAVLSHPDMLAHGEPIENLYAVFTPGRPVAVAALRAARRLTEESNEPHIMLPLADLNTIGWM